MQEAYILVLDDTHHVKHHRSKLSIQQDPMFKIVYNDDVHGRLIALHNSQEDVIYFEESLKKVFVILGAFGDIYMVAKEVPEDSIIACSPEYASILYELFPDIEVYEIEGVDRNKLKDAVAICAYKYPTRDIILAQQDGEGTDVVKPYRSYQKYQISRAKL